MDWLMRPVLARHVSLAELKDGSVSLADLALLNDALDCQAINDERLRPAGD